MKYSGLKAVLTRSKMTVGLKGIFVTSLGF